MKFMRFVATIGAVTALFVSGTASAQGSNPVSNVDCSGALANSSVCRGINDSRNPLFGQQGILTRVANIFALLTGVISVFMVIIGGLRYITSGGDPGKTASAKNTILYAAIGMAVAAVSGTIVRFLLSRL